MILFIEPLRKSLLMMHNRFVFPFLFFKIIVVVTPIVETRSVPDAISVLVIIRFSTLVFLTIIHVFCREKLTHIKLRLGSTFDVVEEFIQHFDLF